MATSLCVHLPRGTVLVYLNPDFHEIACCDFVLVAHRKKFCVETVRDGTIDPSDCCVCVCVFSRFSPLCTV